MNDESGVSVTAGMRSTPGPSENRTQVGTTPATGKLSVHLTRASGVRQRIRDKLWLAEVRARVFQN